MSQTRNADSKSDSKDDARKLAHSVALLKSQALQEERKRAEAAERKHRASGGSGSPPPVQEQKGIPSVVYPLIEFGYDAEGGAIKNWMEPVREVGRKAAGMLESTVKADAQTHKDAIEATLTESKRVAAEAEIKLQVAKDGIAPAELEVKARETDIATIKDPTGLAEAGVYHNLSPEDEKKLEAANAALGEAETKLTEAKRLVTQGTATKTRADEKVVAETKAVADAEAKILKTDATIKKFNDFENEIKSIQNGWMDGRPVDPDAMKRKVQELKAEFANPELKLDPDDITKVNGAIEGFNKMLDQEVARLKNLAQEKAYTNRTFQIEKDNLSQEIFYAKLQRASTRAVEGNCELVWRNQLKPDGGLAVLKTGCKRGYIIVGDSKDESTLELYYTNLTTGEKNIKVCEKGSPEMQDFLREMKQGDASYRITKWWGNVLTTPKDQAGVTGEVLSSAQENRVKEITNHVRRPENVTKRIKLADWKEPFKDTSYFSSKKTVNKNTDWKEILPIAIQAPNDFEREKELRVNEEKLGLEIARDNALERLKKKQNSGLDCEYNYLDQKFKIKYEKDDEGKYKYTVLPLGGVFVGRTNMKAAMTTMVELCHASDPLCPVELTCGNVETAQMIKTVGKQLEHAINAAWEAKNKGIYIGIELSDNAKKTIDLWQTIDKKAPKDLQEKAAKLYELWKENVWDKEQKKATEAVKMVAESDLGKLLVSPSPLGGLGVGDAQLSQAFKEKEPDRTDVRLKELELEVEKMERKVEELIIEEKNIQHQLKELDVEMKKPEVVADTTKYDELRAKKEGLAKTHDVVKQNLEKLAGNNEEKGMIKNFLGWLRSTSMTSSLGVTEAIKAQIQTYKQARDEGKPTSVLPPDGEAYVKMEQRIEKMNQTLNSHLASMAPAPVPPVAAAAASAAPASGPAPAAAASAAPASSASGPAPAASAAPPSSGPAPAASAASASSGPALTVPPRSPVLSSIASSAVPPPISPVAPASSPPASSGASGGIGASAPPPREEKEEKKDAKQNEQEVEMHELRRQRM